MRGLASSLAAGVLLSGCVVVRATPTASGAHMPAAQPVSDGTAPPAAMAWLYGSAEAAALSEQAYNGMVGYVRGVLDRARDKRGRLPSQRRAGTMPRWPVSMVLAPGATAASAETVPCGALPPAIMLDMDETAVLNLGYEYEEARTARGFDAERWSRWEKGGTDRIAPVPGAVAAFRTLRAMGVTMVINTNRSAANARDTERALKIAGLGEFRHGETLFLKGDVDDRPGKDGRRLAIAQRYCVLALAGDQLGDFADLFNPPGPAPALGRRALSGVAPIEARWGQGWFVLPNPVYGTGLGTDWDETFPADKRWSDTAPVEGANE